MRARAFVWVCVLGGGGGCLYVCLLACVCVCVCWGVVCVCFKRAFPLNQVADEAFRSDEYKPVHIIMCSNTRLCLQGKTSLAWQRPVLERREPSLCPSCSHCCARPRGSTPSSSPPPGSWRFRSPSSLRPWAPASASSVVSVGFRRLTNPVSG